MEAIQKKIDHSFLKVLEFKDLLLWDVKRYYLNTLESSFEWIILGRCIKEENHKIKPSNYPDKQFGILGVNNVIGIFDAYTEIGININQPYKKVENGWLVYNPYRINVGSIGLKTEQHKHTLISPAYIVFSCNSNLLSQFLFLLFRSKVFNKIIRDSTTGSVRQNLTIDSLKNIKIPLPAIQKQKAIIKRYDLQNNLADRCLSKAREIENEQILYLNRIFGIRKNVVKRTKAFKFIAYRDLQKWGLGFALYQSRWKIKSVFEQKKIGSLCKIGSGGTPNTNVKKYYGGDIPWVKTTEVVNDIITDTEEKITVEGLNNSSARIFPTGSLIVAMYGQGLTRGRTAKLGIDASTNQACAVLYEINNDIILTDFLWLYLINEYERLREMASGNSQPNLNAGMIYDYVIQVPPLNVQREIIKRVAKFKDKIKVQRLRGNDQKRKANEEFDKTLFTKTK